MLGMELVWRFAKMLGELGDTTGSYFFASDSQPVTISRFGSAAFNFFTPASVTT